MKLLFFFSSRRRHTRLQGDWSSDVCSSDLEKALEAYLRGARCIPALPWCDWEALKLAAILGRPVEALEAASRLSARAPEKRWVERSTQPVRVADVVARVAVLDADKVPWVRLFDLL